MKNIIFIITSLLLTAVQLYAVNDTWIGHRYAVEVTFFESREKNVNPPSPNSLSMPDYPIELAKELITGVAVLSFSIDEHGSIYDIKVASADHESFAESAKKVIEKWSFTPARNAITGKNVPMKMKCRFSFNLSEKTDEEEAQRP